MKRGFEEKIILISLIGIIASIYLILNLNTCLKAEAVFFDVGQGDSALLKSCRHSILIDTGSGTAAASGLAREIPSADGRLDILLLSHLQSDHMGGVWKIIGSRKIGALVVPEGAVEDPKARAMIDFAKAEGMAVVEVSRGSKLKMSGLEVDILWPLKNIKLPSENDGAIVALARFADWKILFTSDIGARTESYLTEEDLRSDVLKVAHHGSKYSSTLEFLKSVSPALSVMQLSLNNSYGHGGAEIMERLEGVGSRVLRTDKNGEIRISKEGGDIYAQCTKGCGAN